MAENNNVTGSVVGKVRFTIDKKSWDNLDKFQKKLTSVKKQMSGLDKTIKVQTVVNSINKVTNAVVKSEKAVGKAKEETAKKVAKAKKLSGDHSGHLGNWQTELASRKKQAAAMLAMEREAWKENLAFDRLKLAEQKRQAALEAKAWRENEQFDKQKQRAYESRRRNVQSRWDKRKANRLKAGGKLSSNMSTFDARVEAFKLVKEGQLERTKAMRGWSDAELTAAKDRLYKTIDSSRGKYTGANAGDIQLLRAEVNNVVRGMQTMDAVARKNAVTFRSLRNEIVQMTAAFTAFTVAQNIAQTGFEFESLRASARVFAKDDAGVAEHMAFISEQAHRLGLDLSTATKEFTKFSIATQSNMSKKDQRELFVSMSEYSRVLGLNKQDYERAFRAVQQIECCLPIQ